MAGGRTHHGVLDENSAQRERDRFHFFMAQLLFWMLAQPMATPRTSALLRPGESFADDAPV